MKLGHAIAIASESHKDQKRFDGSPYVLHPLRVMAAMETEEEKIVAVLHDVIEDSDVKLEDLALPDHLSLALSLLTHKPEEDYFLYIERIKMNPLATKVKLADLADNMSL